MHWELFVTLTGVYVGNNPGALDTYSSWMGAAPDNVLFYINSDSWSAFDSSLDWAVKLWRPSDTPVVWSVPLTVVGTSLDRVAHGSYNSHFARAAQALAHAKRSKDGAIYVRVGWEFNGDWMPWSAQGQEAAFIGAFHNLVDTFRAVSSKFRFVWDVNASGNYDPVRAYPGDDYVDVVGIDLYYDPHWDSGDPNAAFLSKVNRPFGLQWQQDFAAAHGKATAVSEWGVQTNDAGPFIQSMTKWMADHQMVYENYWNADAGGYDGVIDDGEHPNAAAAYRTAILNLQTTSSGPGTPPVEVPPPPTGMSAFGTLTHDSHSVGGTIYALFEGVLGRLPDLLGLEHWANALNKGMPLPEIAQAFLSSPEGQPRWETIGNAEFAVQLYHTALHRDPDPVGLAHWLQKLDAGISREDAAISFALSDENLAGLQNVFEAGVFVPDLASANVARLYYAVLGRSPDAAGLNYWSNQLRHGAPIQDVAETFFSAVESMDRTVRLTNDEYINMVYQNALGRNAEQAGLDFWATQIEENCSRVGTAVSIGLSAEAQLHHLADIEIGWTLIG